MKILIGSTNPSKIDYYTQLLAAYPVTILSLTDLNINSEPEESGKTPEENALIKAKYYGQFFETVIRSWHEAWVERQWPIICMDMPFTIKENYLPIWNQGRRNEKPLRFTCLIMRFCRAVQDGRWIPFLCVINRNM